MSNSLGKEKIKSSENLKNHGNTGDFLKRLGRVLKDKDVKKGGVALARTFANVALSGVDFIPGGWGEVADIVGLLSKLSNTKDKDGEKIMNLLPDVSAAVLLGANVVEPFFGGAVPSYVIPTLFQFNKDRHSIAKAFKKGVEIMKNENEDYKDNKTAIDQAVNVFVEK